MHERQIHLLVKLLQRVICLLERLIYLLERPRTYMQGRAISFKATPPA
jgi:hypothetical protein